MQNEQLQAHSVRLSLKNLRHQNLENSCGCWNQTRSSAGAASTLKHRISLSCSFCLFEVMSYYMAHNGLGLETTPPAGRGGAHL
ncbi:mCG1041707 [Mus musculus]|nr:mCG1041707 [Mus musculus]